MKEENAPHVIVWEEKNVQAVNMTNMMEQNALHVIVWQVNHSIFKQKPRLLGAFVI
ncbi:MAG: hypothetical protein Q8M83_01900 [bacterium]|nr:hypothetical protein [bacterium]